MNRSDRDVPTHATHEYRCTKCGLHQEWEWVSGICKTCQSPLEVHYDLQEVARRFATRPRNGIGPTSMWRYAHLLPVVDEDSRVSLGEGCTPLLRAHRLGDALGLKNLYLKIETGNPTGSFKDRGASVTISKALEDGAEAVAVLSAGNTTAAFSAYGSRAGVRIVNFVLDELTNDVLLTQIAAMGHDTFTLPGTSSDASARVASVCLEKGWFNSGAHTNPFRVEGKKTVAYEIVEELGWNPPDVIVCPTAGGTSLLAMEKAFSEMMGLGWVDQRSRLVCVQSTGCAPLVRAFATGDPVQRWETPTTVARGLSSVMPARADDVLGSVRNSEGHAVSVDDEQIVQAMLQLAQLEGVFAETSSAASVAALKRLAERGDIHADQSIVCVVTGTGLKDTEVLTERLRRSNATEFGFGCQKVEVETKQRE